MRVRWRARRNTTTITYDDGDVVTELLRIEYLLRYSYRHCSGFRHVLYLRMCVAVTHFSVAIADIVSIFCQISLALLMLHRRTIIKLTISCKILYNYYIV